MEPMNLILELDKQPIVKLAFPLSIYLWHSNNPVVIENIPLFLGMEISDLNYHYGVDRLGEQYNIGELKAIQRVIENNYKRQNRNYKQQD